MHRHADAYLHQGEVIILSARVADIGYTRSAGPYFKAKAEQVDEIGKLVLTALDASIPGYVSPEEWEAFLKPFLKFTGERTWGGFVKRSKYIRINEQSPDAIAILPSLRGKGGAFYPQEAMALVSGRAVSELGSTVLLAFNQSE